MCLCMLYLRMHQIIWEFSLPLNGNRWSQRPRGLRHTSAAARLPRLWVQIPLRGAWMSVCCGCCVLSGRGLCSKLIIRPDESYWLWCVVCDVENSWMRRPWPTGRLSCQKKTRKTKQKSRFPMWSPCNVLTVRLKCSRMLRCVLP